MNFLASSLDGMAVDAVGDPNIRRCDYHFVSRDTKRHFQSQLVIWVLRSWKAAQSVVKKRLIGALVTLRLEEPKSLADFGSAFSYTLPSGKFVDVDELLS